MQHYLTPGFVSLLRNQGTNKKLWSQVKDNNKQLYRLMSQEEERRVVMSLVLTRPHPKQQQNQVPCNILISPPIPMQRQVLNLEECERHILATHLA